MEELYGQILEDVNVMYVFLCNLITYIIIDSIENNDKKKVVISSVIKRLISAVSAILIGIAMKRLYIDEPHINRQLFCGFFIQFLTWDYVFKSIVFKLKEKFEINNKKNGEA